MKLKIKAGTTQKRIKVFVQDSTGAGKTGVLYNHLTCTYISESATSSQSFTLASGSLGVHTSGGWAEVSSANMPGLYELSLPSTLTATTSGASIVLMLRANGSTATGMLPVLVEIELDKIDYQSASYAKLEASADTIVSGSAVSGTLSTTEMTTNLPSTVDDHYNGRVLIITNGSSTTGLLYQATNITDYDGTTKKLTFTALSAAPSSSTTFIIV